MWRRSGNKGSSDDAEKSNKKEQQAIGNVDSGICSDNILLSAEFSSDIEEEETTPVEQPQQANNRPEPGAASMRADSGLDIGLSDTLSNLSIKNKTINQLDQRTSVDEKQPVLEPIVVRVQEEQETDDIEPWQLYYIQDIDGDTQLHIAIIQGFLEEAAFSLIKMVPHPCLLDIVNDDGHTPLHLAVLTRQPRIVRRLILAGADPTARDFKGYTPLHLACSTGDLAAARALTDSMAPIERNHLGAYGKIPALPQNLEQNTYTGKTCLHIAAENDQVELVRLLLRLGADLEAREGLSGRTALQLALESNSHSVTSFLLHDCRPDLEAQTYAGLTAYQLCILNENTKAARELLDLGARAEELPDSGSSSGSDSEDEFIKTITRLSTRVGVRA